MTTKTTKFTPKFFQGKIRETFDVLTYDELVASRNTLLSFTDQEVLDTIRDECKQTVNVCPKCHFKTLRERKVHSPRYICSGCNFEFDTPDVGTWYQNQWTTIEEKAARKRRATLLQIIDERVTRMMLTEANESPEIFQLIEESIRQKQTKPNNDPKIEPSQKANTSIRSPLENESSKQTPTTAEDFSVENCILKFRRLAVARYIPELDRVEFLTQPAPKFYPCLASFEKQLVKDPQNRTMEKYLESDTMLNHVIILQELNKGNQQ